MMSLANAARITYGGEVLCCLDQSEVKAVEPFVYRKIQPQNLWNRVRGWFYEVITGTKLCIKSDDVEIQTKISFKDGTWIRLKMPFMEFVNEYC